MYQLPFMPQQAQQMPQARPGIPAPQGQSAAYSQGVGQQALMQKQMEEEKKRQEQQMYFQIANTIFGGMNAIGGLMGGRGGGAAPAAAPAATSFRNV